MDDDARPTPRKVEVRAESDTGSAFRLRMPVDSARDHMRGGKGDGTSHRVVVYSDFLCPHCRRLRPVLARLRGVLGDRLIYVFRHFPNENAHPGATFMARAAEAADKQGLFWAMHDRLYESQLPFGEDAVLAAARDLGADIALFAHDLASAETIRRVESDIAEGQRNGIVGTPTIFVDGIRYDGAWDFYSMLEALQRPIAARLQHGARAFASLPASAGIVLLAASIAALVCANSPLAPYYHRFNEASFGIGAPGSLLSLTVREWLSDGLLSVFFLLVGLEIRREMTSGALVDKRAALLPAVAAVGGVLVPAAIYFAVNQGATAGGWAVPTVTDVAFTIAILALLGSQVSSALRVFVATLGVVDDMLSVLTLAILFPPISEVTWLLAATAFATALYALNRCRVYGSWPYLVVAAGVWFALHGAGVHAALAGVVLAVFLPTRPAPQAGPLLAQAATALDTLEDAQRMRGLEQQSVWHWASAQLAAASDRLISPAERIERTVAPWTAYVILPLFAFSTTGVALNIDFSAPGAKEITVGVVLGLVLGKPIGICLAALAAVKFGFAMAPDSARVRQFIGAACLCGIGYSASFLMADQVLESGLHASIAKMAALAGSVLAAAFGAILLALNFQSAKLSLLHAQRRIVRTRPTKQRHRDHFAE